MKTLGAAAENQASDQRTAAVALAATSLKTAIDAGKPFEKELAYFASLDGASADAIAALQPYAQGGVPTLADLQSSFGSVANAILKASKPDATGMGETLIGNLQNLVSVRPSGAEEGDTPRAVVGRMTAALGSGDLRSMLSEASSLPEAAQTAAKPFLSDVEARASTNDLLLSAFAQTPAAQ